MSRFLFLTALAAVTFSSSASAQLTSTTRIGLAPGESAARQYAESRAPRCCASCAAPLPGAAQLGSRLPRVPGTSLPQAGERRGSGLRSLLRAAAVSEPGSAESHAFATPHFGDQQHLGQGKTRFLFERLINNYRAGRGLPPVRYNPGLDGIAARNNMLQQQRNKCGHWYTGGLAQNAAKGQASLPGAFRGWQNSPGHNALLLDRSKREFGIHGYGNNWTLMMR